MSILSYILVIVSTLIPITIGSTDTVPITFSKKAILPGGLPITLTAVSQPEFKDAVFKVLDFTIAEVEKIASQLDETNPLSEISQINLKAGNGVVAMSPHMKQLLDLVVKVQGWTHGNFDITADSPATFASLKINIPASTIRFSKPAAKINMNGIKAGYLADSALIILYNSRIDSGMVTVGSASRSIGKDVVGPWKIAIPNPGGIYAHRGISLTFSGLSVATVNSENGPTIHPRTKAAFAPACKSVTLVARDAATAQAIAGAVYVLGPIDGMNLITELKNVRGVITDLNGNLIKSAGL